LEEENKHSILRGGGKKGGEKKKTDLNGEKKLWSNRKGEKRRGKAPKGNFREEHSSKKEKKKKSNQWKGKGNRKQNRRGEEADYGGKGVRAVILGRGGKRLRLSQRGNGDQGGRGLFIGKKEKENDCM